MFFSSNNNHFLTYVTTIEYLSLTTTIIEFQCWAFTSCEEEKGIQTSDPTTRPTPAPIVLYVPGYGGAQVPIFGGTDWSQFQPTDSPAPSASGRPSVEPTLPPGVVAKEMLATYFCGELFERGY